MLVEVNGDVAERLMADGRLKRLEKETGKRVFLESSQALPVDSFSIVIEGTPAEVEKEVERIMAIGRRGTGFMLDSGEMVPRDVPVENMHAMMRKGHELAVG